MTALTRIELVEGDITEQDVDAIVNAANSDLLLGSGVAGAIREKGGPTIQAECNRHGPVAVGGVALTSAGDLPARFIIHAAGMPPGGQASKESVRSCVKASLEVASEQGFSSIAIPAIGAGIGGLSLQRCAELSIEEARAHAAGETSLETIRFVLFGEPAFRLFEMVNDAAKVAAQMAQMERLTGRDD